MMYEYEAKLSLQYEFEGQYTSELLFSLPKEEFPSPLKHITQAIVNNGNTKISLELKSKEGCIEYPFVFLESIILSRFYEEKKDVMIFKNEAELELNSTLNMVFFWSQYRYRPRRCFSITKYPKPKDISRVCGVAAADLTFSASPIRASVIPKFDHKSLANALMPQKYDLRIFAEELLLIQTSKIDELKLINLCRLRELIAWRFIGNSPKHKPNEVEYNDENNSSQIKAISYYYKDLETEPLCTGSAEVRR